MTGGKTMSPLQEQSSHSDALRQPPPHPICASSSPIRAPAYTVWVQTWASNNEIPIMGVPTTRFQQGCSNNRVPTRRFQQGAPTGKLQQGYNWEIPARGSNRPPTGGVQGRAPAKRVKKGYCNKRVQHGVQTARTQQGSGGSSTKI